MVKNMGGARDASATPSELDYNKRYNRIIKF